MNKNDIDFAPWKIRQPDLLFGISYRSNETDSASACDESPYHPQPCVISCECKVLESVLFSSTLLAQLKLIKLVPKRGLGFRKN